MSAPIHPSSGPDYDVLADLAAGLLPPAEDRTIRAHVEGCAECTRALGALEWTGSHLRWLPPIAMPPNVVTRIDSALAEQGKLVSINQLRRRRKKRQQLLSIAAAGVIVLGGGGLLVGQLGAGSPATDSTAAGEVPAATMPDLDETTLPDAVADLVSGGQGDAPLRLEGTPAPQNCVASVQIEGVDELIGVIEIRYQGRNRDAVFFATSDPMVARVIVVDDCSLEDPEIVRIVQGRI